jgi:hypothetical protein
VPSSTCSAGWCVDRQIAIDGAREDGGEAGRRPRRPFEQLHGIDSAVAAAIDEVPCSAWRPPSRRDDADDGVGGRHKDPTGSPDAAGLTALGARISVDGDTITIDGGRRLVGATTESLDDHRLAMTFAIAGLIAGGETAVGDAGRAAISYPGFFDELERVRA